VGKSDYRTSQQRAAPEVVRAKTTIAPRETEVSTHRKSERKQTARFKQVARRLDSTLMIRVPTNRPPTHPGEMLHEEFLSPMEIDARQLAESIHVSSQDISEIISNQKSITPSIALRLAKYFGMAADFWMNLQLRWDL
jgi:antitoxin HigA-1